MKSSLPTPPVKETQEWEKQVEFLMVELGIDRRVIREVILRLKPILVSQKQEIVGKIRKMKKGKPEIKYRMVSDRVDWLNDGYQLALSDILSTLEKEGKND